MSISNQERAMFAAIDIVARRGRVTAKDVIGATGLTRGIVTHALGKLVEAGQFSLLGTGRGAHYTHAEQHPKRTPMDESPRPAPSKSARAIRDLAAEQIAASGAPDLETIAASVGVSRYLVAEILRSVDVRGGGLGRTCTNTLPSGERCARPIAAAGRGKFRWSRCDYCNGHTPSPTPVQHRAKPAQPAILVAPEPAAEPAALVLRTETIDGWPLAVVRGDDGGEVPLVADEELGRRLGYSAEPGRTVRRLAERWRADIGRSVTVTDRPAGGGKAFRRELYTEEQACFLAAKSETPNATALLKGMIAVFVAWRRGRLEPVAASQLQPDSFAAFAQAVNVAFAPMLQTMQTMQVMIAQSLSAPRTKAARDPKPRRMLSRFPGICAGCNVRFPKDTEIISVRGVGSWHVGCRAGIAAE